MSTAEIISIFPIELFTSDNADKAKRWAEKKEKECNAGHEGSRNLVEKIGSYIADFTRKEKPHQIYNLTSKNNNFPLLFIGGRTSIVFLYLREVRIQGLGKRNAEVVRKLTTNRKKQNKLLLKNEYGCWFNEYGRWPKELKEEFDKLVTKDMEWAEYIEADYGFSFYYFEHDGKFISNKKLDHIDGGETYPLLEEKILEEKRYAFKAGGKIGERILNERIKLEERLVGETRGLAYNFIKAKDLFIKTLLFKTSIKEGDDLNLMQSNLNDCDIHIKSNVYINESTLCIFTTKENKSENKNILYGIISLEVILQMIWNRCNQMSILIRSIAGNEKPTKSKNKRKEELKKRKEELKKRKEELCKEKLKLCIEELKLSEEELKKRKEELRERKEELKKRKKANFKTQKVELYNEFQYAAIESEVLLASTTSTRFARLLEEMIRTSHSKEKSNVLEKNFQILTTRESRDEQRLHNKHKKLADISTVISLIALIITSNFLIRVADVGFLPSFFITLIMFGAAFVWWCLTKKNYKAIEARQRKL